MSAVPNTLKTYPVLEIETKKYLQGLLISWLHSCYFLFAHRATVLEKYDKFWTGVTLKLTANSGLVDRGDPPTV